MQLLIDTNSKLMMDNACLQVAVGVMRKSFQSYINDIRRGSDKDEPTVRTLLKFSLSERRAETLLESSYIDTNQEELPDLCLCSRHFFQDSILILRNSPHSIPEKQNGNSGDDWTIEGEDTEEANNNGSIIDRAVCERAAHVNSGAAHCKSADLLVGFGETESRRHRRIDGRLCHSQSETLVVDYGETRRALIMHRLWSSLKF